jgi:hypothetical protein
MNVFDFTKKATSDVLLALLGTYSSMKPPQSPYSLIGIAAPLAAGRNMIVTRKIFAWMRKPGLGENVSIVKTAFTSLITIDCRST